MLNLRNRSDDLEILIAVVDCGGFSAAAEQLNIQVARVSRAVSKIEQQIGVTLLNRTTRRIYQTDEGRRFIEAVRLGLLQLQHAEEELLANDAFPKGKLRIDAASPFVLHQLVPLIHNFKQAYPNIDLELSSNEGYVDLLEKRVDVAIRIGRLSDSTLHARPLGKSPLYVVASPDYLARRGVPLHITDLQQHDLLGFTSKNLNLWPLKGFSLEAPSLIASNGETVRQLVLSGNGIACLSGFMVKQDIAHGTMIRLFGSEAVYDTGREQIHAVYYKSSSLARRISSFIDFIQPRLSL